MAKPIQVATIESDGFSCYIVWGSEGSVYRPRPSQTSHDVVYVFSKHRSVVPHTARVRGYKRQVMQCKDIHGNKYLLVYDKDLRELWAWHGTNANTTNKVFTPYDGISEPPSNVPQVTGAWHRSNTLVAVLRGRL